MEELNNRHAERYRASLRIEFVVQNSKQVAQCRTIDISTEGMSFLWQEELLAHSDIRIRLHLPTPKPLAINISAKVSYSVLQGTGGFRVGVRYTEISAAESAALKVALAHFPTAH